MESQVREEALRSPSQLSKSIAEVRELLVGDLVYARMRKVMAKDELDERYFCGMVIGIEGALKALGVIDIEMAIVEYDLKYDR